MTLETGDLVLRLALATVLGGAIGLEREFSDQPAGFRTHILVSLGAALFTLAGAYGADVLAGSGEVRVDPTRVAAQVVTGIGFLGAGAIIQQGVSVRGLTTAASLWVTAAIGMAVGLGYLGGAIGVALVALVALALFKQIEHFILDRIRGNRSRLIIDTTKDFKLADLTRVVDEAQASIEMLRIYDEGGAGLRVVAVLRVPGRLISEGVASQLKEHEAVTRVELEN